MSLKIDSITFEPNREKKDAKPCKPNCRKDAQPDICVQRYHIPIENGKKNYKAASWKPVDTHQLTESGEYIGLHVAQDPLYIPRLYWDLCPPYEKPPLSWQRDLSQRVPYIDLNDALILRVRKSQKSIVCKKACDKKEKKCLKKSKNEYRDCIKECNGEMDCQQGCKDLKNTTDEKCRNKRDACRKK